MWLFLIVAALLVVLFSGRWFVNADPKKIAAAVTGLGGAAAIALGALLAARGAIFIGGPLVLVGAGALFPGLRMGLGRRSARGGHSEIDTPSVLMRLDRLSGALDGAVKRGPDRGRWLSELDESQVRTVLAMAETDDPDGTALLRAYIERRFGGGGAHGGGQGEEHAGGARRPPGASGMTEEEALAVLGLNPGASADEIREAHRRLMVKLHPDQGGSSWLAAKLNAARDRLLD